MDFPSEETSLPIVAEIIHILLVFKMNLSNFEQTSSKFGQTKIKIKK